MAANVTSLARRGFYAVARVCSEGGARVSTTVMVRDLDVLAPQALDSRLEVAEGLPLFGGMQLAIDATLVNPLHCDGAALPGAAHIDGVALHAVRHRKERTYPELRLLFVLFECLLGKVAAVAG